MTISLNCTAANNHNPENKHYKGKFKEHCHDIYNTLPYNRMPAWLTVEMVYTQVFWLNFPHQKMVYLIHLVLTLSVLSPQSTTTFIVSLSLAHTCKLIKQVTTLWKLAPLVPLQLALLVTHKAHSNFTASLLVILLLDANGHHYQCLKISSTMFINLLKFPKSTNDLF